MDFICRIACLQEDFQTGPASEARYSPACPLQLRIFCLSGETGRDTWGALPLQMDFSPEAEPSGHVLMPLPQRKARDCEVCGKNRAVPGGRKRSRHWCPGCGVGVHEHCYHRLVHFRRINRRGRKNSKTYIHH